MSLGPLGAAINIRELDAYIQPMLGKPLTRCWEGYGSAVFFEVGKLRKEPLTRGRVSLRGQFTISITGGWRIEGPRAVRFGVWSSDGKIERGLKELVGSRIEAIEVEGQLPEIAVILDGNVCIRSFYLSEGQPDWSILFPDDSWLECKRGKIERGVSST